MPVGWLLFALGGLLFLGSRKKMGAAWIPTLTRTDPHGHRTPPGPEWKAEHQPKQWPTVIGSDGQRHSTPAGRQDFVKYLLSLLASQNLLTGLPAMLLISAIARETGWGLAVYNNAWGNVKATGTFPWHRLSDHEPYRSFLTPEAGAQYLVRFLGSTPRYAPAWQKLTGGDSTWYGDLGREGYYEGDPDKAQHEHDQILAMVQRYAGA